MSLLTGVELARFAGVSKSAVTKAKKTNLIRCTPDGLFDPEDFLVKRWLLNRDHKGAPGVETSERGERPARAIHDTWPLVDFGDGKGFIPIASFTVDMEGDSADEWTLFPTPRALRVVLGDPARVYDLKSGKELPTREARP